MLSFLVNLAALAALAVAGYAAWRYLAPFKADVSAALKTGEADLSEAEAHVAAVVDPAKPATSVPATKV